jgi:hypothetical protein
MSIRITAIRREGGSGHEHITRLWWVEPSTGKESDKTGTPRATVVSWIEDRSIKAYVEDDAGHRVNVEVRVRNGQKHLQTRADGVWTDNLLSLPKK